MTCTAPCSPPCTNPVRAKDLCNGHYLRQWAEKSISTPLHVETPLIGRRFEKLVVVSRSPTGKFLCTCDCGGSKEIHHANLIGGRTTSCGCTRAAYLARNDNMTKWPEYHVWQAMKERCRNPNFKQWKDYGGRGIRVCPEWENSFQTFIKAVGRRPSRELTIERIDNDGNYEPGNVRWETRVNQSANRRCSPKNQKAQRERRERDLET